MAVAALSLVAAPCFGQGKGGGGGKNKASLSVTVTPNTFNETDEGATGTVTRENSDTSVPLTVDLLSNDDTEAIVPPIVEIPAGAASVDFPVTAVDDTDEDGNQTVTILATASGHPEASTSITVTDNETVNVGYRVRYVPIPENAWGADVYQVNDLGQAVGTFILTVSADYDRTVSYFYDSTNDTYVTSDEMLPTLPAQWTEVDFVGLNNLGAIAGRVRNKTGDLWAGLLVYPEGEGWTYEILPGPEGSSRHYVRKINDHGDMVGRYLVDDGEGGFISGGFAINTGLYDETLALPVTDFQIVDVMWPFVSNARVGVLQNADAAYRFDFDKAYTLYDSDPDNDQDPASIIPLPSENYFLGRDSISDEGQLACYETSYVGKQRGRDVYANTPAVFQDGEVLWKANFEGSAIAINSAAGENLVGDLLGRNGATWWIQHADRGYIDINDMLVFDNDTDRQLWYSEQHYIGKLSNRRDAVTSFGYIGGHHNAGPWNYGAAYVLVPVVLP
jgi:hypothetical protein